MKHYIMYYHGGSGNHGCEALARTTAELLDYKKNRISLASFRPDSDKEYGIDQICDIHKMYEKKKARRRNPIWWDAYFQTKIKHSDYPLKDLPYLNSLGARRGDIALSIGGDNYCYNDTLGLAKANDIFRRNGIKTVLWGCSIEPELLDDPVIAKDISGFDLITARESISFQALKRVNQNTVLVSDSAFWLKSVKRPLPAGFENTDIVGINISPLVQCHEKNAGITMKNYERLIEYIISETQMNILLIPHVIWDHDNDLTVNESLFNRYSSTNRIANLPDYNCEELKGYISQCKYFVGARTHATIAAYSSIIPTLVLGYSVKSKGIARDLFGTEENYVLSTQSITGENELVDSFNWIMANEVSIKNRLSEIMPEYKSRVKKGVDAVKAL